MKLLFLDVETTSLSPQTGKIIEIGGVIVEILDGQIKVLDSFESLVKNDVAGEKILAFTKINEQDLKNAKDAKEVKILWNNWLLKWGKIEAIVGHSIDFDINFLKYEEWFLPCEKLLDTLILSKILLGGEKSINLESLAEKLKLGEKIILKNSNPHRALYDSFIGLELFKYLLKIAGKHLYSLQYQKVLNSFFEPVKIDGYLQENGQENWGKIVKLICRKNFLNQTEFVDKTNILEFFYSQKNFCLPILNECLDLVENGKKNTDFNRILLAFINNLNRGEKYIHLHGLKDEQVFKLLTAFLLQKMRENEEKKCFLEENCVFTPLVLEDFTFWQKKLLNSELNLSELAFILDIFLDLKNDVKFILNEVDFLNFQIKSQVSKLNFTTRIMKNEPTQIQIFKRLENIQNLLQDFLEKNKGFIGVKRLLWQKLQYFLQILNRLVGSKIIEIEPFGEGFNLLKKESGLLQNYLKNIEGEEIISFLDKNSGQYLQKLFGGLHFTKIKYLGEEKKFYTTELTGEISDFILEENNLIFLANNRDFEEIEQKLGVENYHKYLMFGLHGGVNKILNKRENKTKILRLKDWIFAKNLLEKVEKIIVISTVKTYLDPHFTNGKIEREKMGKLNFIKTLATLNQIYKHGGKHIYWLENLE